MKNSSMTEPYIYIANFAGHAPLPENGILSRTVQNDGRSKVIQFCFAPGQELSAHTAPFPATIYIVQGEGELQLGADRMAVQTGSFAYMPARLEHALRAHTEVVMLLTLLK
jgi:quercetin dioxygenase-like cupin family protein